MSSGFLALHALATPGVVLHEPNAGFVIATPIGLLLASGFAAASALTLDERTTARLRAWQGRIRLLVAVVLVLWAVVSLSGLSPLDRAPEEERSPGSDPPPRRGVLAYAFAALRYLAIYRRRRQLLPLAVAVAFVLLAEALIAVAFGRAWHASWWEWHVLMAIAFGAILLAVRSEYRRERSLPEAFGGLYTERTLERLDDRRRSALLRLTEALRTGEDPTTRPRASAPTGSPAKRSPSSSGRRRSSHGSTGCSTATSARVSLANSTRSRRSATSGDASARSRRCSPTSSTSRPSARATRPTRSSRC